MTKMMDITVWQLHRWWVLPGIPMPEKTVFSSGDCRKEEARSP